MKLLIAVFVALSLSGCGGGSNTTSQNDDTVVSSGTDDRSTGSESESPDPVSMQDDEDPEQAETPSSSCDYPVITYFDSVEAGVEVLENFCGTPEAYAEGVRLVNSALGWDVKALYGLIAASSTYFGDEVDLTVSEQIHAEAEALWRADLHLTERIRENRSTSDDRYLAATLLMFDYALWLNGDDRDVQRHFSLWQVMMDGQNSDLSEALLVLYEFMRFGNMSLAEERLERDPELKIWFDKISRVI